MPKHDSVAHCEDGGLARGCQQLDSLLPQTIANGFHLSAPRSALASVFATPTVSLMPVSRAVRPPRHAPHSAYFTPPQLARRWNIHVDKVLAFIRSGTLTAFNVASLKSSRPRYRISAEAVATFERDRAAAPPPAAKKCRTSRARQQQDRPVTRTYF